MGQIMIIIDLLITYKISLLILSNTDMLKKWHTAVQL